MSRSITSETGHPAHRLYSSLYEARLAGIEYSWMKPSAGTNSMENAVASSAPGQETMKQDNAEQDNAVRLRELRELWKQQVEAADRIASMAAAENQCSRLRQRSSAKLQAMETERKFKTPKSRWQNAVEISSLSLGHTSNRRTERMIIEDEEEEEEERVAVSVNHPIGEGDERKAVLSKKHKYENYLSDVHEAANRAQERRETMAQLGVWWNLFTGEAAEMLMYWYHQGWSIQTLAYVAKSRLQSNIPLLEGREIDMVGHFIYAREMNRSDLVKMHGAKRVKTQEEEDVMFISGESQYTDGAVAYGRESRRREAIKAQISRRRTTRLPPGAMQRLKTKNRYQLCQDVERH